MALVSSSIFFSASLGPVGFGGVTLNGRRGGGGGGGDSAETTFAADADVEEATIGVEDDDNDALDGNDAVAA